MSEEATIRRGVRNARYTTVPNHVFEDVRLSMEARWLLGYLLSKPDNWTVILGDIARRGGCGRDKARRIVNELVQHGYADKEQEREEGRFGKLSLVIFDEPRELRESTADAGVASLPQTENPSTVNPSTVNPTLVNTDGLAKPESSISREREREDSKKIDADGWALLKSWPGFDGMPKEPAMRIWRTLDAEERATARRRFLPWLTLLRAQKKSHIPAPSTYLTEKLWQAVPDPAEAPPAPVLAAPFGKAWGARRAALLLAGSGPLPEPKGFSAKLISEGGELGRREELSRQATYGFPEVSRMHQLAADGKGWTLRPEVEPAETVLALMAAVRVGSDEYRAWKALHDERGWPWLPDPGRQEWVYFPVGGPDGLEAFEQAVRGKNDDGGERQAAE
ncbi:helix-turn-helix domain-containing protein [Mesorhizobium sp. B2-1-3A]|uniref:helix-turn-helix domain-containing protein n=1 Tax=Mesorhizobium sp. B2-1-3A TaxID=2589971 RepID=UPI0015E299A9|nr:helix-turn-helix domain-containing protein [Mesorhizobium sp. B2-1-3A]